MSKHIKRIDRVTVIMPGNTKTEIFKILDELGIKRSEGIREILVAFVEGRCTIEPRTDHMSNLFKAL